MFYDKRNAAAIATLRPKAQDAANASMSECAAEGLNLLITVGYRSWLSQQMLWLQGRKLPGRIVTNARGGMSFHQYRVAIDFVPEWQGKVHYEDGGAIERIAKIFKRHGWEWGGDWVGFRDSCHLQYTQGHDINYFRKGGSI